MKLQSLHSGNCIFQIPCWVCQIVWRLSLTYMGMMCCTSVQLLESFATNLPSQKAIGMCHASVQLFEFSHKFAFTKGYRVCHTSVQLFPYICLHKRLQGLPTSVQLFEFSPTFAFTKGYRVYHTCSAVRVFPYICLHKRWQHTRNKPPMVWNKVNWVNCLSTLAVGTRIERLCWKHILSKEYRMWN
jgi:hypothetical protein